MSRLQPYDGPAPLRAVSASQHSGVAKALKDSFVVETRYVSAPSEIVPGIRISNSRASQQFVLTITQALAKASTERHLQDAVFNAMNALANVTIPSKCKKVPKDSDLNFLEIVMKFVNPSSYAEKDMKTILEIYATEYFSQLLTQEDIKIMQDAEPGLFVRATSRPDIAAAVLSVKQDADQGDEEGNGEGDDMTLGEVKNADNFSVEDAETQEAAYLMLLLYWWRVVVGRDVQCVFGFTICGPLCSDLKQRKRNWRGMPASNAKYAISLLKLTVPETLGDVPTLHVYKGESALTDKKHENIHWLFEFLASSHLWANKKDANIIHNSCAPMFTAPKDLCQRLSEATNWSMQQNGTSSLVFRCVGKDAVWDVMKMADREIQTSARKTWAKALDNEDHSRVFYVKVNTKATNRHFPGSRITELRSRALAANDDNFVQTYPVDDIPGETCYFILMVDRGQRVNRRTSWSQDKFDGMFRDLWSKTTQLSSVSKIFHGDIAHHNILLEEEELSGDEKLVLIDWDEAQNFNPKPREAPRGQLYWELVYSEGLRDHPMLHTEMQLSLLYWRLKSENVDNSDEWWMADLTKIKGLQEYVDTLATRSKPAQLIAARAFVQVVKDQLDLTSST